MGQVLEEKAATISCAKGGKYTSFFPVAAFKPSCKVSQKIRATAEEANSYVQRDPSPSLGHWHIIIYLNHSASTICDAPPKDVARTSKSDIGQSDAQCFRLPRAVTTTSRRGQGVVYFSKKGDLHRRGLKRISGLRLKFDSCLRIIGNEYTPYCDFRP